MFSLKTWSVFRLSYGPHHRACSVVSEFLFSLIFFLNMALIELRTR